MIFALIAAAVVPALMLMWFFHSMDLFREPPKVLWITFVLGVLTIPGVLIAVFLGVVPIMKLLGLENAANPYVHGTLDAFFHAAIPEELFKFFVLFLYAYRHKEFDEPMDGIVYGAVASLGFASLENVLYVTGGGMGVAIMRALTAVPGHACSGAIMGYFIGQAKFRPAERGRLILAGLFFPILLHGLYDAPLLSLKAFSEKDLDPGGGATALLILAWLLALGTEVIWSMRLGNRVRIEQLKKAYPPRGAAVPVQYGFIAPAGAPPGAYYAPPMPYAQASGGGSRVGGCFLLFFGGIFGAAGGLMTLGFGLAFGMGKVTRGELGGMIIASIIIGLFPLALGALLFGLGIRSLNRAGRAAVPLAVAIVLSALLYLMS